MQLKEYQLVLEPMGKRSSVDMKVLTVPSVFAPISKQSVKFTLDQNKFLK